MDTRALEYFVAVAEELSFTRAAERMFVVQSTMSAGIRSLETDLGTALFERAGRRVALTAAGEALLPAAREIIDSVDRLRASATGAMRGRLRVGIFANLDVLDLADALGEFRARYPFVELQLVASPTGSTGLAEDVRRGRLDLAFMGIPSTELPGVGASELLGSRVVAVLPSGHPLATRRSVALAELADEAFVDTPSGFGNRIVVERALAAAGVARRVATEVASLSDIGAFVAAGFGVALAPHRLVAEIPGTVHVDVEPGVEWTMSVITRPRPSAATAALRDQLVARFTGPASTRTVHAHD